jgi:excisionase family DNA binding protein
MPQFVTINQAAEMLHVSRVSLYRRINDGELPSILFGRKRLIPASFLKELEDKAMQSLKPREGA